MPHLFIRILNKLKLLDFLIVYGAIKLNARKFKVPIIQKIGFSNLFMTEPWMIGVLKITLPINQGNFIDVGVNVGQTLLKIKSISSDINYIGFEPNSTCINYVNNLISVNQLKNTILLPFGISNKSEVGELNFFYNSSTDSSASIIEEFRPEQKIERKEFIPLYDLKRINETVNIDSISILKIDVEGAELEVLNSFQDAIAKFKPIVLIEILPAYSIDNNFRVERQEKIQNLLSELNYSIFRIIKTDNHLIDIKEIDQIEIHSDLNMCEYIMVHEDKKSQFEINRNSFLSN